MADRSQAAEKLDSPGAVDITIRPQQPQRRKQQEDGDGEKLADKNDYDRKLQKLIDQLSGGGGVRMQVMRLNPETNSYMRSGTIDVDDAFITDFDNAFGRKYGAGTYWVRPTVKSKPVGEGFKLEVDPLLYPPKRALMPDGSEAPLPGANAGAFDQAKLMMMVEQTRREHATELAKIQQQSQAQQQQFMFMLMQQMQDNQKLLVEQARALGGGGGKDGETADPLKQLTNWSQFMSTMGWTAPGAGGGNMPLTERVLGMFVNPIASKVGEKVASAIGDQFTPTPATPAAALPSPTIPRPGAQQSPAAMKAEIQAPAGQRKLLLPPGAKPYTKDALAKTPIKSAGTVAKVAGSAPVEEPKK